jgi:hypothetical protein
MLMIVLCLTFEFYSYEERTQICDDSIGYAKAVHDVIDELDCFGYVVFH